jgi:hypothetical protein
MQQKLTKQPEVAPNRGFFIPLDISYLHLFKVELTYWLGWHWIKVFRVAYFDELSLLFHLLGNVLLICWHSRAIFCSCLLFVYRRQIQSLSPSSFMRVPPKRRWPSKFYHLEHLRFMWCHIAQCRMSSLSRRLLSLWKQRKLEIDMHTRHNPITTDI